MAQPFLVATTRSSWPLVTRTQLRASPLVQIDGDEAALPGGVVGGKLGALDDAVSVTITRYLSSSKPVTRIMELIFSSGCRGSRFLMFMPRLFREPSGIS